MADKVVSDLGGIRYRTGSDLLNNMVGGGLGQGYPGGRIVNLVGDKSSGKTFLACEIVADSYWHPAVPGMEPGEDLEWRYDDCESGFSFDTQSLYGFEIMPADLADRKRSRTVEELYSHVREFFEGLPRGKRGIYIVDSLDGLSSDELVDRADERYKAYQKGKAFDEGSYKTAKAKFLSQEFFPPIAETLDRRGGLLVIVSQVRENIQPMSFEKFVRAGGKAMDFYCHTVLWLAQIDQLKKRERAVGVLIRAQNSKSKTPRPYRNVNLSLLFDYGLDNVGTNLDFLFNLYTDTGRYSAAEQKEIIWEGQKPTVENLTGFITDNGLADEYKAVYKKGFKKSDMLEWLGKLEAGPVKDQYKETFGTPRSREELIQWIVENRLETELTRRAIEKWEEIENSIRTRRPRKYSE